jgi:hypothetical protein
MSARIPLLIGVTGHRDLRPDGIDRTLQRVDAFFETLQREYRNTQLVLYSGLAAGADQLVTEIALTRKVALRAVLPMPRALYERDFTETELPRFRELLARAESVVELPLLGSPDGAASEQYASLGDFLTLRTHLLLALWNGVESEEVGGTAWTIRSRITGRLQADAEHVEPIEAGLTYVIPVERLKLRSPELPLEGFVGAEDLDRSKEALREIEIYNAHILPEIRAGADSLPPDPVADLAEARDTADALAVRYQRSLNRARKNLHWVVAALVLTFAVYSEFWRGLPLLFVYLAALTAGIAVWSRQRRQHVEQRFYDYRALAEALRVQHVWSAGGLARSVAGVYLRKHRGELHWIRFVMCGYATDAAIVDTLARRREAVEAVQAYEETGETQQWIAGQRDYFERSAIRHAAILKRSERISGVLLLIGLASAVGSVVTELLGAQQALSACVFLMAVAPALSGTLSSWLQHAAIAEEASDRTRMARLFDNGLKDWLARPGYRRALVSELGSEALHENADWLLLHRSRPLEAPLSPG